MHRVGFNLEVTTDPIFDLEIKDRTTILSELVLVHLITPIYQRVLSLVIGARLPIQRAKDP